MIIAVDARNIYRPHRRGIGKTLLDVYRHLAALRPDWQIVVFYQQDIQPDPLADLPNVQRRQIDIPGDRWNLWQELRLPWAVHRLRPGVLHCPANTAPAWGSAPVLLTIHDLIPLEPGQSSAQFRWGDNVAAAAKKARAVMTPSQYTAERVHTVLGVAADKIVVNPWAASPACQGAQDESLKVQVYQRYGLDPARPYVLALGGADERKNSAGILRAWSLLDESLRRTHTLLMVGLEGPALEVLARQAAQLGILEHCRLHGFADEADMPGLMAGATVLCYPSLSEGFGLPILDGFACRTAVLTGNATSLPEVAGDAALLVDARLPSAIAEGLGQLLTRAEVRQALIERGTRRLQSFTWEMCAARLARAVELAAA
jgi:glycosyltransferase involved in cell wall biosynthesis